MVAFEKKIKKEEWRSSYYKEPQRDRYGEGSFQLKE